MAGDGSIKTYDDESTMPVYRVYFQLKGRTMCWRRETEGCRSSTSECDIAYCNVAEPWAICLKGSSIVITCGRGCDARVFDIISVMHVYV